MQSALSGLPLIKRKSAGKNVLQGQGKVGEIYIESGKIDIFKISQRKLK